MGHYASEMDPKWGEHTISERKLAEISEDEVRALAQCLFTGFNTSPHLEGTNSVHGISVAYAIDDLICKRINEALTPGSARSAIEG